MNTLDRFSEWAALLRDAQHTGKVSRAAVVALVQTHDLDTSGRELLAGVIEERFKYKNGRKSIPQEDKQIALLWFRYFSEECKSTLSASERIEMQSRSVYDLALDQAASRAEVETRTVKNWIKEERENSKTPDQALADWLKGVKEK